MIQNLKNPQFIHIISEVVVLIGIILWVSSQNRSLSKKMENLLQRCEEQELQLQKMNEQINLLTQALTQMQSIPRTPPAVQQKTNKRSSPPTTSVVAQPPLVEPIVDDDPVMLDKELEEELRELREGSLPTIVEEDLSDNEDDNVRIVEVDSE